MTAPEALAFLARERRTVLLGGAAVILHGMNPHTGTGCESALQSKHRKCWHALRRLRLLHSLLIKEAGVVGVRSLGWKLLNEMWEAGDPFAEDLIREIESQNRGIKP
jgi:hypothetical protein